MPDPVPEEKSHACMYDYKHSVPEYRKNRQYDLAALDGRVGLCLHCVRDRMGNASCCQVSH